MAKTSKSPYNPQLEAERKVLPANQAEFEAQKGSKRVQRVGEQFYMTCVCNTAEVTSDIFAPTKFINEHESC